MCRQYNDFGSIARDRLEGNLNSVDFAEFESETEKQGSVDQKAVGGKKKAEIFQIAEYERRCLDAALSKLGQCWDADLMSMIKLFVCVTDLYGQIYVARDIGVRKLTNGNRVMSVDAPRRD
jgi:hypothetical protein